MNAKPQRSQRTCLVPHGSFWVCIAPGNLSIQPLSLCIAPFTQMKISLHFARTHLALAPVKPFRKVPQRWLYKEQDTETELSYRAHDSFSFAHITSQLQPSQAQSSWTSKQRGIGLSHLQYCLNITFVNLVYRPSAFRVLKLLSKQSVNFFPLQLGGLEKEFYLK